MIKHTAAAIGAITLSAMPVSAYNAASIMLNSELVDAVKATGTQVVIDSPKCEERNIYGSYEISREIDRLTICSKPHGNSVDELTDTIRHEAWHIVQVCNEGKAIYSLSSLTPYIKDKEVQFVLDNYPQHQHHIEIEARVIAAKENETYIIQALRKHCSN